MPICRNVRSLSPFGLAVQRAPPLYERVVRRLSFGLVFVKTTPRFSVKHLIFAQPEQDSRNVIAPSVGFLKGIANINSDIDDNFINQSPPSYPHAPFNKFI